MVDMPTHAADLAGDGDGIVIVDDASRPGGGRAPALDVEARLERVHGARVRPVAHVHGVGELIGDRGNGRSTKEARVVLLEPGVVDEPVEEAHDDIGTFNLVDEREH